MHVFFFLILSLCMYFFFLKNKKTPPLPPNLMDHPLVLAMVHLQWMLMANQNLLQKHARNFIYAINLNETGYIKLFSLTEKIYEKNCFRKGLFLANLIFKNVFLLQKTERSPKLRFIARNKCTEVILSGILSSSLSHNWVISARSKTLKSTHQYVAMSTAEPISIFLC